MRITERGSVKSSPMQEESSLHHLVRLTTGGMDCSGFLLEEAVAKTNAIQSPVRALDAIVHLSLMGRRAPTRLEGVSVAAI